MKLYLPLKCTSLPHYLKAGVIKPFCMYKNILKDDIQALLGESHYILLLKAKNKMPQNADFLVELDINDDDKNLIVFNEYFLYKFLLPITKITAIFSKNQDLNDKYIDLIENSQTSIGGDAFICHSFFTTENFIDFELKIDNISEHKFDQKILNRIDIFDKILGAFAFARFKENNRHYANFFDELALINENFKKQYENIVKTNYTRVTFNKNIDEKDLLKAFKVLGGFYILESADVDLFFAALKANDVKKGDHAVQEVIREIRKFNGNTRKEFVVLFNYGYFKGYQNIRNRYFDKKVKFFLTPPFPYSRFQHSSCLV